MTLLEILEITKNLIDETDVDEQIDIIVKSAINEAYNTLCSVDKRVTTAYIPIINGVASLPEDYISTVKVTPKLKPSDMYVGNTIVTDSTGVYTLVYSHSREDLVNDSDEPDLHPTLVPALWNWAAYKYWMHRKRNGVPDYFLQAYSMIVNNFITNNNSNNTAEFVVDWR